MLCLVLFFDIFCFFRLFLEIEEEVSGLRCANEVGDCVVANKKYNEKMSV